MINGNPEIREYLNEETKSENLFLYRMGGGFVFVLFSIFGINPLLNYRAKKEKHFQGSLIKIHS